jgi:hypothetical protein
MHAQNGVCCADADGRLYHDKSLFTSLGRGLMELEVTIHRN